MEVYIVLGYFAEEGELLHEVDVKNRIDIYGVFTSEQSAENVKKYLEDGNDGCLHIRIEKCALDSTTTAYDFAAGDLF